VGTRPTIPDLSLADAEGRRIALSDLSGRVVLLTFWTTSCGQCRTESSWFSEFQQAYGDKNLAVVGVALDTDGWSSVKPFLKQEAIDYRVVMGDRDEARSVIGTAIPTTLILDRENRISVRHVGFCSKAEYRQDIERILAE
jgi:peroxiredoxin